MGSLVAGGLGNALAEGVVLEGGCGGGAIFGFGDRGSLAESSVSVGHLAQDRIVGGPSRRFGQAVAGGIVGESSLVGAGVCAVVGVDLSALND